MSRLARRTEQIVPFHAVEVSKRAHALHAQGRDIISLGIGEPDFSAPPQVVQALHRAASAGRDGYTAPAGLSALRGVIADYYAQHFGAPVAPERVIVTAGASGALLLAAMTLIEPGDEVLMPDPSYPANQNFIAAAGGRTRLITCYAEQRYQLSAQDIHSHWGERTRGVLIASPSNPTGTTMTPAALRELLDAVRARGGFVILDEIYLGLYYDSIPQSGLAHDDTIIVINSFSKYFHMTGWRLGWLIAPQAMVPVIEKLAASLAICAPSLAQYAALACFEPEVLRTYEERRLSFQQRRDYLVPALEELGLRVPVVPDGAFYVFCDISQHSDNSDDFAYRLLDQAGVAVIPGRDFGAAHAARSIRVSYTVGVDRLQEAVERMARCLNVSCPTA